mgnify:CR=1 FL=1
MKQVRLRAMEPEDLEMLYSIENDPEVWGVSCTSVPYSRYVLHDYLAQSSGDIYADRQVRLVIEVAQGNERVDGRRAELADNTDSRYETIGLADNTASRYGTIGLADILNFEPKHCRAEVGIVIIGRYRGQGYATLALKALHRYALQTLHLHQLYAFVGADNISSVALFRKLGYTFSEPLADWLFDGRSFHGAFLVQKLL